MSASSASYTSTPRRNFAMHADLEQKAAFEHAVRPYLRPLYQSAYRLTGSVTDAEDLLQELLLKLFRQFDQWRDLDQPKPWLQRVLYNLHVDMYRKRSHTHGANPRTLDDDGVEDLAANEQSPAQLAEAEQHQQRILTALADLGPRQRALVTLHLIEGHTLEESAAILDEPLGTLKSRLHRCKSQLKRSLRMEPFTEIVR